MANNSYPQQDQNTAYNSNTQNGLPNNQSPQKPNKNNKKLAIIIGILLLLVIVGGGAAFLMTNNDGGSSEDTTNDGTSQIQDEGGNTRPAFNPNNPDQLGLPATIEEVDEELQGKRDEVNVFLQEQAERTIDVTTLSQSQVTEDLVVEMKKEFTTEPVVRTNGLSRVEVTIDYENIGDQDFKNGTLYIKLSEGLELEKGSIVDSYNGKQNIQVSDDLYNSELNLITYGPGTSNKQSSRVGVNESGQIKFIVEVADSNASNLAVTGYLQEPDGRAGKPAVIFIEN